MSAAGAIRAGAAYVEVFLEQNPLTRGLSAVQSRLRGWSASLGRLGAGAYGGELPGPLGAIARFASSPAGMFAGLLTAAKMAATAGTEIADLAEKAGTSVEAISALAYAARRTHVDAAGLATGIKKMQVVITDAARGGKQGQEALAALGLTAADLSRLLPEEQFRRIADRIAAIQNPTERTAAAVKIFGRNGSELLPLLLQGSDGIAKWEARARQLGLVVGGEAAEGARRFNQLLGDLYDVAMNGVKVIGGAVIPELTRFVNWLIKGTAAARDWIKDHKSIVLTALQVTGAVVAGGVALSVMAAVLRNMAGAIGLVLVPLRLLSSLAATVAGAGLRVAASLAGTAWTAAAMMARVAWAAFAMLGSALGAIFSAAGAVVSAVWTTIPVLLSAAWTVASVVASTAWVVASTVAAAAWTAISAIPPMLAAAWSAAAAVAGAAWTAVAFAIDALMSGVAMLPFLLVGAITAAISIVAVEIYFQLSRAFRSAGKTAATALKDSAATAGKEAGQAASDGLLDAISSGMGSVGSALSSAGGTLVGWLGSIVSGAASAFSSVLEWLKQAFMGLADDARKTFGGISDALAAGDIALAAKVLWAMLKLEWQKGLAFLESLWDGFKGFWSDAVIGLAMIFTDAVAKIRTLWAELIGWLEKKWNAFKVSGFTETLASWFAPIFAKLYGVSVEETQKNLTEDFARGRQAQPQQNAEIDAATEAQKAKIEADRKGAQDALTQDKLRADKERGERTKAAQADVDAARKELDDAVAKAKDARQKAENKGPDMPGLNKPDLPDISNLAAAKASVAGTFSSSALSGLGTGTSIQQKMEGHLADIKVGMGRLVTVNERMMQNAADGVLLA